MRALQYLPELLPDYRQLLSFLQVGFTLTTTTIEEHPLRGTAHLTNPFKVNKVTRLAHD